MFSNNEAMWFYNEQQKKKVQQLKHQNERLERELKQLMTNLAHLSPEDDLCIYNKRHLQQRIDALRKQIEYNKIQQKRINQTIF